MTINKLNYETYALDYLEGNLSEELIVEMKQFLEVNPEIEAEFLGFKPMLLIPDTSIQFEDKEQLKRPPIIAKVSFVSWGGWLFSGILLLILSWLFIKSIKTQIQTQTQTTQKTLLEMPLMEINEFVKETPLLRMNAPLEIPKRENAVPQNNREMTLLSNEGKTSNKEINHKTSGSTSIETEKEVVHLSQKTHFSSPAEDDEIHGFAAVGLYPVIEVNKQRPTKEEMFDKTVNNVSKVINQNIPIENTVKRSIMTLSALSSILLESDGKDWYYPEVPMFKPSVRLQLSLGYGKDFGLTLLSQNANTALGVSSTAYAIDFQALTNYQISPYYALQTGIGLAYRPLTYTKYSLTAQARPIDLDMTHTTISIPLYLVHSIPFVIDKAPRFNVTVGGAWNKYGKSGLSSTVFSFDDENYLYEIEQNGSSFSFYNGLEYLLMNNKKNGKLGIEVGYHHQFNGLSNSRIWKYDIELNEKIDLIQEDIQSFKYLVFKIKYTPNL